MHFFDLPNEIIFLILAHLPLKSLLIFRSISTQCVYLLNGAYYGLDSSRRELLKLYLDAVSSPTYELSKSYMEHGDIDRNFDREACLERWISNSKGVKPKGNPRIEFPTDFATWISDWPEKGPFVWLWPALKMNPDSVYFWRHPVFTASPTYLLPTNMKQAIVLLTFHETKVETPGMKTELYCSMISNPPFNADGKPPIIAEEENQTYALPTHIIRATLECPTMRYRFLLFGGGGVTKNLRGHVVDMYSSSPELSQGTAKVVSRNWIEYMRWELRESEKKAHLMLSK
ncbi:hypothetical protein ABKN59_004169 [Abortiporus biennis]